MHAFHCILTIFLYHRPASVSYFHLLSSDSVSNFIDFISTQMITFSVLTNLCLFYSFRLLSSLFSLLAWSKWHFSQRDLSKMYILQTFHHWPFAYLSSLASFLICVTLILSSRLLQSTKYALLPFFSRSSYTLSLLYRVSFFFFPLHRVLLKWSLMRF